MATTESAGHALYGRLEEVIGTEHADTLTTCLHHLGSDEPATKADITRLETRFDRLEDIVRDQQRFCVGMVVASMIALTAAFSVVVSVFG